MAAAVMLLLGACAGQGGKPEPQQITLALPEAAAAAASAQHSALATLVLREVNARRPDAPLSPDPTLVRAASAHSADMAQRDFMGHHNPDGLGPRERIMAVQETFEGTIAENVGEFEFPPGFSDAAKAKYMVDKWMNSPRHAAPLRGRGYERTGIGLSQSGGKVYATQLFAGP